MPRAMAEVAGTLIPVELTGTAEYRSDDTILIRCVTPDGHELDVNPSHLYVHWSAITGIRYKSPQ